MYTKHMQSIEKKLDDLYDYLKANMATKTELEDAKNELKEDFRSKTDGINRRIDRLAEDVGDMRYSLKERLEKLEKAVFKG